MHTKLNMEPIREMVSTGKQALKRNSRDSESEHLSKWKKQMSRAVGSSLGAIVFGGIALVALKKAMDAAHRHQEWRHNDEMLDERLAGSLDASDAVASY